MTANRVPDLSRESLRESTQAFSLVELLVVVAILAILATMVYLNAPGLLGGAGVSRGSQAVYDILNYARENAITKNVPTIVVIRRTGPDLWQRLAIFSIVGTDGNWEMVSRWQNLPRQASVDPDYDPSAESWTRKPQSLAQSHAKVAAPATDIKDAGQVLSHDEDYYAVGFLPDGGLISDDNVAFRIVRARNENGQIVVEGGEAPVDWTKLIIEKVSGQVKEIRVGQP